MEWSLAGIVSLVLVAFVLIQQMFVDQADARKIANYSIPGEQCDSGYIIDNGDQYEVHSAMTMANGSTVPSYVSSVDCSLRFRAEANQRILIRIVKFKLEHSVRCEADALYLLDGVEDGAALMSKHGYGLCGKTLTLPNYFSTTGNGVTVRFVSNGETQNDGFRMFITPFTTGDTCSGFRCSTHEKCITADAFCNGANQCEDGSDEPPIEVCNSAATLIRDVRIHCAGLLFIISFLMLFLSR